MGFFKLGKMTFGSLFKKPETLKYPFEVKEPPQGLKGHIVVDAQACILCGMCDRSCTADAIEVDKAARLWKINPFQCIQCGYCVTTCPKKCLSMEPSYWKPANEKLFEEFAIPEREKPAKAHKAANEKAGDSSDIEKKLAGLDPEKAAKVRAALEAKAAKQAAAEPKAAPQDDKPVSPAAAETDSGAVDAPEAAPARDAQMEAMLALMDAARAQAVRDALK